LAAVSLATIASAENPPLFELTWGSTGSAEGEFTNPTGIEIDDSGDILVADFGNDRIQKFSADGTFLLTWGSTGSGAGQFNSPQGVAVGPGGVIYVADTFNNRIQKFAADTTYITEWGTSGSADGEFNFPRDVAVGPDSSVYVADANNQRVQKFDADGNFLLAWGSSGSGDGEFNSPQHVAVGSDGSVYVADTNNDRIQKFDAGGTFILTWGTNGSGDGEFKFPRGMTVDAAGNLYAADQGNHRVQKFDGDGNFITGWGGPPMGSGDGEFNFPEAVAADGMGNVYVVDAGNDRVQKFAPLPEIAAITDIGNDQGRNVRIDLLGSSQDVSQPFVQVLQYEAFRRIDPLPSKPGAVMGAGSNGSDGLQERIRQARAGGMVSSDAVLLLGWEFVGAIPAHAEDDYNMVAPTLADSTVENGIHDTFFFIRAATDDPAVFYDSVVDSGYSVDNLVPNPPNGFAIEDISMAGDVTLGWFESEAPDFRYFSLHRSSDPDFIPSGANLVTQITETSYIDVGAAPGGTTVYYKLSATDFSGNESDFAEATNSVIAVGPGSDIPVAFALHGNVPNPLSDRAVIGFDLPVSTPVSLTVYDARGRVIRQGIGGSTMPAGRHQWVWDRRDNAGTLVAPGIYFYRLVSPQFSETRKAVVID
jgi:sugar lactone lactonase YvrE